MTEKYKPKVGDRVRIVLEGEVAQVYSDGDFGIELVENYRTDFPHEADFSIEKVEPPVVTFKPGDVVRKKTGAYTVALSDKGYTYIRNSVYSHGLGRFFSYNLGTPAEEFTSEHYEKVEL